VSVNLMWSNMYKMCVSCTRTTHYKGVVLRSIGLLYMRNDVTSNLTNLSELYDRDERNNYEQEKRIVLEPQLH
jgi:hypothetical protein